MDNRNEIHIVNQNVHLYHIDDNDVNNQNSKIYFVTPERTYIEVYLID